MFGELDACQRTPQAAEAARRQLRETCTDPAILTRYEQLRRDHHEVDRQITRLQNDRHGTIGAARARIDAQVREAEGSRNVIVAEMDALDARKLEV